LTYRNLGTELVTIYVGNKPAQFVIHKKLLCDTTDFFLKAFSGSFKESEGVLRLPEESPGVFSLFIDWLYRSRIAHTNSGRHWVNLFNLYIFAEKLCLNELANRTMDRIRHTYALLSSALVTPALASHVYRKTFTDSPLRIFCIEALAYQFCMLDGVAIDQHIPSDEHLEQILEQGRDNSDFFLDYFRYLREYEGKQLNFPGQKGADFNHEMSECKFHRHAKDEDCYEGTSILQFDEWDSETQENANFFD
jgi:hypothetical protein